MLAIPPRISPKYRQSGRGTSSPSMKTGRLFPHDPPATSRGTIYSTIYVLLSFAGLRLLAGWRRAFLNQGNPTCLRHPTLPEPQPPVDFRSNCSSSNVYMTLYAVLDYDGGLETMRQEILAGVSDLEISCLLAGISQCGRITLA